VSVEVLLTPGHTPGSICLLVGGMSLLTGDTLFIGDCGRTDLAGGDDRQMYATMQRLKGLDDAIMVYPGHDYGSRPADTIGNQKRTNKALSAASYADFHRLA
jgi:glyoxylase-like metal-dependent hydrolase (beta-lactamase superfamily II)